MNNRQRKKWLKKHGKYVNPKECWCLDYTIAEFVLPRLKKFKKDNNGYPGILSGEDEWDEILDKMILAFDYIIHDDDWWMFNLKYDYTSGLKFEEVGRENGFIRTHIVKEDWVDEIEQNYHIEAKRRNDVIEEGLELFVKYFRNLWW